MITEDQLEQLFLDRFRETGWDYVNGVDISPDANDLDAKETIYVRLLLRCQEVICL